jgi:dynein heavy chain, axonemal
MPPVAGSISWARSIFYRIKRSIIKFLTKEDTLDKDYFQLIKKEYKELAKMIDHFQKEKFTEWNDRIIDKAMGFLKKEILMKVDEHTYHVNFSDEFKILIKEAKQLEKMGYKIPKTIINISL